MFEKFAWSAESNLTHKIFMFQKFGWGLTSPLEQRRYVSLTAIKPAASKCLGLARVLAPPPTCLLEVKFQVQLLQTIAAGPCRVSESSQLGR